MLPHGVSILGGAPKIGKSWMVLDWCVRIAKGENVWNLTTEKGTVLYLCLEDSLDSFNVIKGYSLSAKSLKQMMNKFRYDLEDNGVQFVSHRSNGQRLVEVSYQAKSDSSVASDEESVSVKTSVPFVPCDPVGEIQADKRKIG